MRWSDIPFDASRKTLRQFAGLWIVFFGALAAWQAWRGNSTWGVVWALVVGPLGLAKPDVIRPIFVGWMVVAFPIGWTISRLILGLLYYVVFTPLALAFRLTGRDILVRRERPVGDTYWIPKPAVADVRRYYRQF